jgi:hypothetical protein
MLLAPMGRSNTSKSYPAVTTAALGRGSREIEQRLDAVLRDLAIVLLSSGYGIARMSQAVRRAYVSAARGLDSGSGRKFTNARIAALTGLTRSEVARLSTKSPGNVQDRSDPVDRAQRVALGWASSAPYCGTPGKPRRLPFSGASRSFTQLVRKYSGDIPPRAMLFEMQRLGMVRIEQGSKIVLLRLEAPVSRQTLSMLKAITPWIRLLSANSKDREFRLKTHEINIALPSLPQTMAAIKELENRTNAFIRSIEELGRRERSKESYAISIRFALATNATKSRSGSKQD